MKEFAECEKCGVTSPSLYGWHAIKIDYRDPTNIFCPSCGDKITEILRKNYLDAIKKFIDEQK